jgi:hypothetical protein
VIGWMLEGASQWLLGFVKDTLNLVWKLLAETLFHLPDVTRLPQVMALTGRSLLVVNTCYVLAITAAGIAVMISGSIQLRYGAGELLPRLVIGLVAANFAVPLCRETITLANALVLALTGQGIATDGSLLHLLRLILAQLANPTSALLMAVIGLILIVLVVMLIAGWITRAIILIVLCGIGPVALACHATPWTEGLARLWWRSLGGVAATVVLQAVAMNVTLATLLDPSANLRARWLPFDPTGILNLFIVAVLLWITVRIPGQVRRYVTQGGGRPNMLGAIVRLVVVQQLTRGLIPRIGRRP